MNTKNVFLNHNYNQNKNLGIHELADKNSKKNVNNSTKHVERNFGKDLKNIKTNKIVPLCESSINTSKDNKKIKAYSKDNLAIVKAILEDSCNSINNSVDNENNSASENISKKLNHNKDIKNIKGKYKRKNDNNNNNITKEHINKSNINIDKENSSIANKSNSKNVKNNNEEFKLTNNKNFKLKHCELDVILKKNKQYVTDYILDIFEHILFTENENQPSSNYLIKQDDISDANRLSMMEWVFEIHNHFSLKPETLYLSVNIIDRYLEVEKIKKNRLQLVAISALFIAGKYEEIYPPELRDYVYICKNNFSKNDILKAEFEILRRLNFDLLTISPYLVYQRLFLISKNSLEELQGGIGNLTYHIGCFLLELSILEYKMLKYSPSVIASSAIFSTRKLLKIKPTWPVDNMKSCFVYNSKDVLDCSKEMLNITKRYINSSLTVLKNKYSKKEYFKAYTNILSIFNKSC